MAENVPNMKEDRKKPRGKYYTWNETSMRLALEAISTNKIGINAAARAYGVPKATLHRRMSDGNKKGKGYTKIIGSEADLTLEVETEMVKHIMEMESVLFGYTPKDVRLLAYRFAEKFGLKHRFSEKKQIAGKKWYYNFMKRHPELSLRQPRATSFNRATAFNKEVVKDFFDKLIEITDKHTINEARHIYNVDETGLSTVQRRPRKILAKKGKHQVGSITSGERGTTTTAVCCANASGQCIPPLIIFKRKNAKAELQDGAPAGAIFAYNPESGYITKGIFYVWLQHFVEHVKPSPDEKVLLILDGHATHTKHLPTIELARRHGVVLLSLPGHTSNKLQPLDVSFFKPLSSYYIDETEKWLRQNPGRVVTQFQISMLFGKAYERAASVGNIVHGFRKSGIYPIDRDVFQDYEFVPVQDEDHSILSNKPLPPLANLEVGAVDFINNEIISDPLDLRSSPTRTKNTAIDTISTQSNLNNPNEQELLKSHVSTHVLTSPKHDTRKLIEQVSPGAKMIANELKKKSRKTQKTTELTSSPYKTSLQEAQEKKLKKETKRKINIEAKATKKKADIKEDVSQWYCMICSLCEIEEMIQCMLCKKWVHTECAGARKGQKKYFCPTCKL